MWEEDFGWSVSVGSTPTCGAPSLERGGGRGEKEEGVGGAFFCFQVRFRHGVAGLDNKTHTMPKSKLKHTKNGTLNYNIHHPAMVMHFASEKVVVFVVVWKDFCN